MELDTTKPLTRIENKEWVWYSEHTLEFVKSVWKKKEWLPVWNIVIPYNVYETTIAEADIADRYLYFALPEIEKQHPDIAEKLRRRIRQMTRSERANLTYTWLRWYVEREIHEKNYYNS